ncbi:virulence factor SrfB [Fulvivirgaceae bacterium BMA12]|uniref:Virulence factor SrfB n=1 Tax=Agaribacillus aureus TaxID=3051825 RepID=A0ABT8LAC8_9BACT|nr:virulence factor SrfB [Fulvivirgaceae bacterium BMA12]
MNEINLIANSGLQFVTFKLAMGPKSEAMKVSMDFAEIPENVDGEEEVFLRHPYYYSRISQYIWYHELNPNAIDPIDGSVDEDKIDVGFVKPIKTDHINSIGAKEAIECFENSWMPVPYLRYTIIEEEGVSLTEFQNGPNSWARMFISAIPETEMQKESEFTHYLVLAFDTMCRLDDENDDNWWFPKLSNEYDDHFEYLCDYRDRHLSFTEKNQSLIRKAFERKPEFQDAELYLKEFQLFLTLLSVLQKALWKLKGTELSPTYGFPKVTLHDPVERPVDVTLVLDIGNSRTCGILSEISDEYAPFDITKSVPLEIRDFSRPYLHYFQPFDMRVVFVKSPFDNNDDIYDTLKPFTWPSICRVGPEAARYSILYSGTHSNSQLSSPKRYLWDLEGRSDSWQYLVKSSYGVELAIDEVLTPELTVDGRNMKKEDERRAFDDLNGTIHPAIDRANYSRSSLMKLALVEILLHAISQINSFLFRELSHKKIVRRCISKIVLTCPTAMLRTERFILRDHADSAIQLLREIYLMGKNATLSEDLEIVPNPNAIHQPVSNRKAKTWEYDEATCSQITFLYSEIKDRFKDPDLFINHLGRKRGNALFPDRPAITIASIDIGGGTTDVMIASYQTNQGSGAAIIPKPLFWESFNLAGDSILKSVIERLVIPAIHDHARTCENGSTATLTNAILELFGSYTGHQKSSDFRMLRKHIVNQILLPVAIEALEFIRTQKGYLKMGYEEIFEKHGAPNSRIIKYVNRTFEKNGIMNFDIRKVNYEFSDEVIESAVVEILKNTLAQLSSVIAQFHCDFVLLAGRPTNLPIVRKLLLQYLPTTPDKIIQLGKYWMGEWYPFIKTSGYIHDPKTCVSVGALIALLSGEMGILNGFSLDISELSKVESTADFVGRYHRPHVSGFKSHEKHEHYMERQDKAFQIDFFDHESLGMKQLDNNNWIGTKMYEIRKVSSLFEKYKNLQPFRLELVRQNPLNIEEINLRKIEDKNGKSVDVKTLELNFNTLDDEYGYWLDTGIFNVELFSE